MPADIAGYCSGGSPTFKIPLVVLRPMGVWDNVGNLVHESLHWFYGPAQVFTKAEMVAALRAVSGVAVADRKPALRAEEECVYRVTGELMANARRDFKHLDSAEAILNAISDQIVAGKIRLEKT
jgi:urea transporter